MTLETKILKLEADAKRLRGLIKSVEFSLSVGFSLCCPWCGLERKHSSTCEAFNSRKQVR